jgi:hypothetical protein
MAFTSPPMRLKLAAARMVHPVDRYRYVGALVAAL